MVAAAVIGAAVVGGAVAADSAENAEDAQYAASQQANQTATGQAAIARQDQMPWLNAGEGGLNQLANLLGISGYESNSGYDNPALNEGVNSAQSAASAAEQEYRAALANGSDLRARRSAEMQRHGANNLPKEAELLKKWEEAKAAVGQEKLKRDQSLAELKSKIGQNPNSDFGSLNRTFTNADFIKDPGYEFRLAEGMKGVENSAAARGGLLSGAALKAASRYNQDYSSNEFGNAANRFNTNQTNRFNRLASIAGLGQTAANQNSGNAMMTGQIVGQNQLGAGNARASGYMGQANALTGALGQGVNMYQNQQYINQLNRQPQWYGSGTSSSGIDNASVYDGYNS